MTFVYEYVNPVQFKTLFVTVDPPTTTHSKDC